jgi:arylsulfatase A-like enzyme
LDTGKVCHEVAGRIDLLTTFANLAGADISNLKSIDGKDISPLLLDPEKSESPHDIFLSFLGQNLYALRQKDWKLSIDKLGYLHLFKMADDPQEKYDLAITIQDKMFELLKFANK